MLNGVNATGNGASGCSLGGSGTFGGAVTILSGTLSLGGAAISGTASGGAITESTGTLTSVPEPSTIVFAGIGMAMFGWSRWTRRRTKARMALLA